MLPSVNSLKENKMICKVIFSIGAALLSTCALMAPFATYAQDDPFDWRSEMDTLHLNDDVLPDFEWSNWGSEDWEEKFIEKYNHYYQSKEQKQLLDQAYQQATDQGFDMPQRHDDYTYDPEREKKVKEDETDYIQRLGDWVENMEDELTETGMDLALELLYQQLEPMLKILKQKNAALLDIIIPQMKGVPVHDPIEDNVKENQEGKQNFKYWVKLAAENIMQSLFKKNAEGKYELQREKIALLKQVGMIRFLKMSAIDWEIMQSITLEVPDEVLGYARTLQDIYQSGTATFQAGRELYRELSTLNTELNIPAQLSQLKSLSKDIANNKLTVVEMVSKRKQLLALTYRQLAVRYQQYGEDLNRQLKQEETLRMTDTERIKALRIASDYLHESLRLQAKAEQLMADSFTYSEAKENLVHQQTIYNKLNRLY